MSRCPQLLLSLLLAASAWAHCPNFPQLSECDPGLPLNLPPAPGPGLYVFLNQVFLEVANGTPGVQSLPIPVSFSGISAPWRAEFQTTSGGDWLSLSTLQGTGEGSFRVFGNTASMKNGTYNAKITITAALPANNSATVNVTLLVRDPIPSAVRLTPLNLTFTGREATPSSVTPQRITVRMEGETTPNWTVSATTLNGGPWLSVSPAAGKGDGEFVVTPSPADLAPGVYSGRINLLAPGATNPAVQLPVLFSIDRQSSLIAPRGIVNAASLLPGPIAPGELLTIAGERLGPRNGIAARPNPDSGRFATSLGGTRVLFDNTPGAILYASANQINVEVPIEVATRKSVKITVESAGYAVSDPVETPVTTAAPGLFSADGVRVVALNQDSSYNTPETPAAKGDVIQLFLTGQGLTTPPVETGSLSPMAPPFAAPIAPVAVTIAGQPAEILFAGLAPGTIGLLQLNVKIPGEIPASLQSPISVVIGETPPPAPLLLAIKDGQ